MKEILIFGCSFSSGSYKSGDRSDQVIRRSKGWYHYVDYFKNAEVTVIDFPGQGYWSWYQLLLMLKGTNRLNYDEIWLQETDSPRATLIDLKKIELKWKLGTINKIDNIKKYTIANKYASICITNPYNFYENLENNITQNIQEFCINNGISGYVWSMYTPLMKCKEFKRLPLVNIHTELRKKHLLVYDSNDSHQTEEGNKYIAKLIDEACIDMKI